MESPSPSPTAAAGTGAVTAEQFLKNLHDSEVLPAEEIQALVEKLTPAQRQDARQLAQELVRHGKLSKYQAAMIYQNKIRGLVMGSYVIQDKLGQGGMGMVFKARHRHINRVVALKVLPPSTAQNPTAVKRFQREVRAAAKLSDPHIVAALDADEANGIHFFVMEYVEGSDLAILVQKEGRMDPSRAVACILQAACGLAHAHAAGIIHRDIKPGNLLLPRPEPQGTALSEVKVLDMGLARIDRSALNPDGPASTAEELTRSGSILGTGDYMAPEQWLNSKRVDHRVDIYSLGCTLHYLLAGKPPYGGKSMTDKMFSHMEAPIPDLAALHPEVSPALQAIFERMLAKKPEDRYASMAELIAVLERYQKGGAAADALTSVQESVHRPTPRDMLETQPLIDTNTHASFRMSLLHKPRKLWLFIGAAAVALAGLVGMGAIVSLVASSMRSTGRDTATSARIVEGPPVTKPGTTRPATEIGKTVKAGDQAFIEAVAKLKPDQQVEAVLKRLEERNVGYSGKTATYKIDKDQATVLDIRSDHLYDLKPLRALPALRELICAGTAKNKGILSDLTPLKGMGLTKLDCGWTKVFDLAPLRGMKLTWLSVGGTGVSNLEPLQGMKLTSLSLTDDPVTDITVLRGMPLKTIALAGTKINDLSPIKDTPLEGITGSFSTGADLSFLRSYKTLTKINGQPTEEFLKQLDAFIQSRPIASWRVLGPLPKTPGKLLDPTANGGLLTEDDFKKSHGGAKEPVKWQKANVDGNGKVNLKALMNPRDNVSAYAYATITSPMETTITVFVGSDDNHILWINGKKIHEYTTHRPWKADSDCVTVPLQAGTNHILVLCGQVTGEWAFSVRVPGNLVPPVGN